MTQQLDGFQDVGFGQKEVNTFGFTIDCGVRQELEKRKQREDNDELHPEGRKSLRKSLNERKSREDGRCAQRGIMSIIERPQAFDRRKAINRQFA